MNHLRLIMELGVPVLTLDAIRRRSSVEQRVRHLETPCWIWRLASGELASDYGHVIVGGRRWSAHRLAYTVANGEIPAGYVIDHLCEIKPCCNPSHLEAVTSQENIRRAHRSPRLATGAPRRVRLSSRARKRLDQAAEMCQLDPEYFMQFAILKLTRAVLDGETRIMQTRSLPAVEV